MKHLNFLCFGGSKTKAFSPTMSTRSNDRTGISGQLGGTVSCFYCLFASRLFDLQRRQGGRHFAWNICIFLNASPLLSGYGFKKSSFKNFDLGVSQFQQYFPQSLNCWEKIRYITVVSVRVLIGDCTSITLSEVLICICKLTFLWLKTCLQSFTY